MYSDGFTLLFVHSHSHPFGTFADKELPYNTGTYANSYAKVELKETSAGQYQIYITCHTGGYMNTYVGGGLSQITITKIDVYW